MNKPVTDRADAIAREIAMTYRQEIQIAAALRDYAKEERERCAAEDTQLLDWLDHKDRSAHEDDGHWSVWLNTAKDSEPIKTFGSLRDAIRAAIAAVDVDAKTGCADDKDFGEFDAGDLAEAMEDFWVTRRMPRAAATRTDSVSSDVEPPDVAEGHKEE